MANAENPSSAPRTPRAVYRPVAKAPSPGSVRIPKSQAPPSKQNTLVFMEPEIVIK